MLRGCEGEVDTILTQTQSRVPVSRAVTYTVRMRPVCFISDYGLTDVLVGTCKGVMNDVAPGATIIDVTHTVPEFDVIRGAETLRHVTRYMPEDSVHLAVVDPGTRPRGRRSPLRFVAAPTWLVPIMGSSCPRPMFCAASCEWCN